MRLLLPKEHGAWAMLIVPFAVSAAVHERSWLHLPLFLGWFFLYLSSQPLLMIMRNNNNYAVCKKWLLIYGGFAIAFLIWPIFYYPNLLRLGAIIVPLLVVNIYFARKKRERDLLNDLSAIAQLSLGAVASGYVAGGVWTERSLLVWLFSVLFFMGSVFYVKTMIREKNNRVFQVISRVYHTALVGLVFIITGSWIPAFAYVPSMIRAFLLSGRAMTPLQIGKLEIANSLFFTILFIWYLK